jgi:hypothetical protein
MVEKIRCPKIFEFYFLIIVIVSAGGKPHKKQRQNEKQDHLIVLEQWFCHHQPDPE